MSQIMEIKFNVEREERKALVREVAEITGCEPVYKGAPSFSFAVGDYTIDRYGTLSFHKGMWPETQKLLAQLTSRGYVYEDIIEPVISPAPAGVAITKEVADSGEAVVGTTESTAASTVDSFRSVVDEDGFKLAIEIPFVGFTSTALENLDRLVSGKAWLIMKALGADALPIERTADTLRFPWFPAVSSHLEVDAYAYFVHALCELAKKQKRVTLTEKPIDSDASEKFAFRCFLLRLGFIGKDTNIASARKILLSKLSGNGSFKSGGYNNRKSVTDSKSTANDEGLSTGIAVNDEEGLALNPETPTAIPKPLRCKDCHHHGYCTDEKLKTSTGEIVDTSKRTPDNYTHYCLGVPSGYRKLKHAVDWSGGETPPKWCPLDVRGSDFNDGNDSVEAIEVSDDGEVAA